MKNSLYILTFLLCCALTTAAQDSLDHKKVEYRFALGVQIGTDIGGALPFPFKNIPSTFNPYPKLSPSLGAKFTFPIDRRWTMGAEATYKKVAMDADARVKDQRFQNGNIVASFTGTAEMSMDFTMLEVPLYFKYTFRNQKDRILVGAYASWVMNSNFEVLAKKGYTLTEDGAFDAPITEEDKFNMDFSESMDNWDAGLILGYERRLFTRIELGLRFMCGFKDIFKPDNQYFDYNMINMRGTLVLSYNLFDIKPPKLNPFKHKNE